MQYLEILSYVWRTHKRFQKQVRLYQQDDLFGDMGFSLADKNRGQPNHISKGYASKILNNKAHPAKVRNALKDPNVRDVIQNNLGLPGLFSCTSTREIDSLVEQKVIGDAAKTDPGLFPLKKDSLFQSRHKQTFELHVLTDSSGHEPVVSGGERGAWRLLARQVLQSTVGIVHWSAEPWSGASYIAHLLRERDDILAEYQQICTIRPSELELPFDMQLKELAKRLKVETDKANLAGALVDAIRRERILVIVSDACFIPYQQESYEKDLLIYQFLKHITDTHRKGSCASVVTIGRSKAVQALIGQADLSYQFDKVMKSQIGFNFYRELFEDYKAQRNEIRAEEGGSRLKRGKWHYEMLKRGDERCVWPGMIRLRAYFASNFGNYAYFDPTMGFEALCGRDAPLPTSIALFQDDLTAYVIRAAAGKQSPELRALRFCSTAKHWLSESALERLRQSFVLKGVEEARVSELTYDAFDNKLKDPLCPITKRSKESVAPSDSGSLAKVFTLSLGIRAIVQDEWRRTEPFEHAVAHWRVASHLWNNQDNKELLNQEFPYVPHWGRSRIFLLGECIRHLVCTIDGQREASNLTVRGSIHEFPQQPVPSLAGCDPSEVINFCYARIFQTEINGNRASRTTGEFPQQGRSLAKRHGAFEYAAELLQLMGENRSFGKPHPNLNPKYRVSYLRECAFAMLDLGELEKARALFKALEKEHKQDSKAAFEDQLNQALIQTELHDLDTAKTTIQSVENSIRERIKERKKDREPHLQRRVQMRKLHILCLEGAFKEAVELSSELLKSERDPKRWDSELIHNHIRALANLEKTSSRAMSETMSAVFRASAEGYQHEALGYRVLLARLFRQRRELRVAEQILDDIQRDILLYGCSERTYLEMLYEAGRTLCADNRHIRAYASYLRPLLVRSKSRNFGRFVNLAGKHSKAVVEMVQSAQAKKGALDWQRILKEIKKEEEEHVTKEKHSVEGLFEIDPLFGYYISGSQDVIEKFKTAEGVKEELTFVLETAGIPTSLP